MLVDVYFNLRTHRWSIRHRGKVIAHADWVRLGDARMHVGESSRQRVIAKRCREVHAWVKGELLDYGDGKRRRPPRMTRITYNPYRAGHFHVGGNVAAAVHTADRVFFDNARGCWANI